LKDFIQLIRPKQWIKNSFIVFPAFFASVDWDVAFILKLILGVFSFSLAASAVYVMNDWFDAPLDKLHPEKQHRPIASGRISNAQAAGYSISLLFSSLVLSAIVYPRLSMFILGYFGMNLAYSAGLKNFPILDVLIIAVGFIIRILFGGVVAQVPISIWMIVVTFSLALFLAFAKRKHDLALFQEKGKATRKSILLYSMPIINVGLIISSLSALVFYVFYTLSDSVAERMDDSVAYTSVFVFFGLLRYYYLTFYKHVSGKPTQVLYADRPIQVIIILWIVSFAWFIYA